jgi:hypothetical protein
MTNLDRRPRFGRFPEAERYAGVSRRRLYQWGHKRPTLFRKNGWATLVDFDVLDEILDELPVAKFKSATADADAA